MLQWHIKLFILFVKSFLDNLNLKKNKKHRERPVFYEHTVLRLICLYVFPLNCSVAGTVFDQLQKLLKMCALDGSCQLSLNLDYGLTGIDDSIFYSLKIESRCYRF